MKQKLLLLILLITTYANAQCLSTPYGQYPVATFVPANTGSNETILIDSWAGEYARVKVQPMMVYTFSTSVPTDYITIVTASGTLLVHGTGSVTWVNLTYNGDIKYQLNTNVQCGTEFVGRARYIRSVSAVCDAPTNFTATNIGPHNVTLNWTAVPGSNAEGYQIMASELNGYVPPASYPKQITTTGTTLTQTTYNQDKDYKAWIRTICNGGIAGTWTSVSFRTTTGVGCTLGPFGQYPGATVVPQCTGAQEIILEDAWAGEYSRIATTPNKRYTYTSGVPTDVVTIRSDAGILLASGYSPVIWNSGTYNGSNIRFYIHKDTSCGTESVGRRRTVTCTPVTCESPSAIILSAITSNSATVKWTAPNPAPANYQYYLTHTATLPYDGQGIDKDLVATNGAQLMDLNPETTYFVFVRSICGNVPGPWIPGGSFLTKPALVCNGAPYGLSPETTFVPAVTASLQLITTTAWAGQYSNVSVNANVNYTFVSSVSTDYITITNAEGNQAYASGPSPLAWSSGTVSGNVRYFIHANASCGNQNSNREKYVRAVCATTVPVVSNQTFCGSATVADLVVTGTAIKWYRTASGGTALASDSVVTSGTYYVSQTVGSCEGPRKAVLIVTDSTPSAPSAENQVLCTNSTIADLTAAGTNLAWYSQAEGGTAINETEPLVAGTYYVSQNNGCESSRTAVTVTLSENCSALLNEHCSAIAAFNTRLYTQSVSGAAAYRFHVTNGANVQVFESNAPSFKLNNLQSFAYNTVYTVKVSVLKGGVWSPYGRACTVSTSSLPTTKVMASQCGGTFTSFNTLIYADAVESATGYRFRVTDGITTQVIEKPTRVFNIKDITGHTYNKTYTVDVSIQINGAFGQYGPACTLSTPSQGFTQLSEGYCGITVTLFNTVIYADAMYQATAYRFRVSDGVTTSIIDKPTRFFTIKNIPGHTYGKTYMVDVAVEVSGAYSEYGPVCTLSTPALRLTQLSEGYCGGTVSTFGSLIYADEVYQATSYRFRVTNGVTTHIIDRPTRSFSLKNFPGYAYNVTYTVAVTALVNGNYNPYGQECTITAVQVSSMSQSNAKATTATEAVTLTAYPNPYTDVFSIAMDTQGRDKVTVRAFDMTGKLVEDITVSPEELASQRLGGRYAAGIYNVIVTQGDYNKSFKIVKR